MNEAQPRVDAKDNMYIEMSKNCAFPPFAAQGEIDSLSPQDLLQACIWSFHEFFTTLVIKKIFGQKVITFSLRATWRVLGLFLLLLLHPPPSCQ